MSLSRTSDNGRISQHLSSISYWINDNLGISVSKSFEQFLILSGLFKDVICE